MHIVFNIPELTAQYVTESTPSRKLIIALSFVTHYYVTNTSNTVYRYPYYITQRNIIHVG